MKKIAVLVAEGAEVFGLGVLAEVWDEPYHPDDDNPVFDFVVCAQRPGLVRTTAGFDLQVHHGWESAADADLVAVAAKHDYRRHLPAMSEVLQDASRRGALVLASCSAVFSLGHAGLLDGRRCTTHWRYGSELAAEFPASDVDTDVLYVEDDGVVTGAGSAAGIDANLHVLRSHFGAQVAGTAARRIVVPPHRDGGQAQFIRTPMRDIEAGTLAPVLAWASARLSEELSIKRLASQAMMSERTFARRFRDETGTTPLQWITTQRVLLAEELLETTSLSVEQIASRSGFANAAALRHHFGAARGTSPQSYRRRFSCLTSDEHETTSAASFS